MTEIHETAWAKKVEERLSHLESALGGPSAATRQSLLLRLYVDLRLQKKHLGEDQAELWEYLMCSVVPADLVYLANRTGDPFAWRWFLAHSIELERRGAHAAAAVNHLTAVARAYLDRLGMRVLPVPKAMRAQVSQVR